MKPIYLATILFAGLTLASCTKDIELKLDGVKPQLVVDGCVTTDTTAHTILLKKTADYFSNNKAEGISGATVTLYNGEKSIVLTEKSKGVYQTPADYSGKTGLTYTLTIENVDVDNDGVKESYTASSILNSVPKIEKMRVEQTERFNFKMWAMRIWMQDPVNEHNYYMARNYRNGVCVSDSINELGTTDDEFFNGVYLKDETFMYFASEKKDEMVEKGDVLMLEICGITEDYLKYLFEVRVEFQGRNPLFGGQPANIRTNIRQTSPINSKTTPHGYFAAYSITRSKLTYSE